MAGSRYFRRNRVAFLCVVATTGAGMLTACSAENSVVTEDASGSLPSDSDSGSNASRDAAPGTVRDSSVNDAALANDANAIDATLLDATDFDANHNADRDSSNTTPDGSLDGSRDATVDSPTPEASVPPFDCTPGGANMTSDGRPLHLACTGLYANWATRTISASNVAFTPGFQLWSDGASKHRWVYLPPNTTIDTQAMDAWVFPDGTKFWKEFSLNGKRIETRLLWKRGTTWTATTYQWSADEAEARELTTGARNVGGTPYEIPTQNECLVCHQGRPDMVLGFEAIALAAPAASGLTLSGLVSAGKLSNPPTASLGVPGNATESSALGWLHANCGMACHNRTPAALAGNTGLYLRLNALELGSVGATDTVRTAVGVRSTFQPPGRSGLLRIARGNANNSVIPIRDGARDAANEGVQMPPIATHVVDEAGLNLVRAWIQSM